MAQKNEVIYNRSVPYNTEAEIYVLGSVFIDNKIIIFNLVSSLNA